METRVEEIRQNMAQISDRVAQAAHSAGRRPEDVRLVVVSKAQPVEVISAAIQAGAQVLGENYPQESVSKIETLGRPDGVEWHMIGHLQSRKAGLVVQYFDLLQSLDSLPLAQKLEKLLVDQNRVLPVLLELNVSGEESKFGWSAWDETQLDHLLPEIEALLTLPHLQVRGLMTMPPLYDDPEQTRPYFARLRQISQALGQRFGPEKFSELSMGTSADFEAAVQEGATYVRIGTAILGPRPPKAQTQ